MCIYACVWVCDVAVMRKFRSVIDALLVRRRYQQPLCVGPWEYRGRTRRHGRTSDRRVQRTDGQTSAEGGKDDTSAVQQDLTHRHRERRAYERRVKRRTLLVALSA